jgi:photosystem II stability/assembly factor-like uncharacterized protein
MPAELTAVDQLNAWVASEGSLFATDNGGRTWRELTPA